MLGRMISFLPGNFLGTGSSAFAARQGAAKDVPAAKRQGAAVVAVTTVADEAAMERLAALVDEPRSETARLASGASGGGDADEGHSAADAATLASLPEQRSGIQGLTLTNEHADQWGD
jgi:hypothetical protein